MRNKWMVLLFASAAVILMAGCSSVAGTTGGTVSASAAESPIPAPMVTATTIRPDANLASPTTGAQDQSHTTEIPLTTGDPTRTPEAPGEAPAPALPTTPVPPASPPSGALATGTVRLTLMPDGSQARYRVREQLAGRSFPNDAVGVTNAITGSVTIEPDGKIVEDASRFVVDLRTLQSDERRRDNFIQRNTLETATYPTAEFVPTTVEGLPSPLPTGGDVVLKLTGKLTIHGVTRPATWDATANIAGREVTGTATTSFRFEDYGMSPPQAAIVLGVVDKVTLEVGFHLVAATGSQGS